jgi:DNA-binding CsgD family transcriptional regulator
MQRRARNVLTLYFLGRRYPAMRAVEAGIAAGVGAGETPFPIEIFNEYLDVPRFGGADRMAALAAHLRAKYSGDVFPDVLLPVGGEALEFFLQRRDTLFPGVPIVHCGGDTGNRTLPDAAFLSGVAYGSRAAVAETLRFALALHPERQHIVVIGGVSEVDKGYLAEVKACEAELRQAGALLSFLRGRAPESLSYHVAALPADALLYFSVVYRDRDGRTPIPVHVLEEIAPRASVPIYALSSNYLGLGVVGGVMPTIEGGGEIAGRMALRILRGEDISTLAPVTVPRHACVDARQLRRWGVSESLLPPGTEVVFRPEAEGGSALARQSALAARYDALTPREKEVMHRMVSGEDTRQIAAALGITVPTTKIHRSHVLKKMGAPSLVALIHIADTLFLPSGAPLLARSERPRRLPRENTAN